MIPDKQAAYWIERLKMSPHREGGYFKEKYRPDNWKPVAGYPADQRVLTTIYYLLKDSDFSAFHRIKSPESWFFHKGTPLLIFSFEETGLVCHELSDQEEGQLQVTIEPDTWFAACLKNPEGFVLVSCAVAPGFDYKDFELAQKDELFKIYPKEIQLINRLCR